MTSRVRRRLLFLAVGIGAAVVLLAAIRMARHGSLAPEEKGAGAAIVDPVGPSWLIGEGAAIDVAGIAILDGTPAAGVRVMVRDLVSQAASAPPRTVITDERGRFALSGLAPTVAVVHADREDAQWTGSIDFGDPIYRRGTPLTLALRRCRPYRARLIDAAGKGVPDVAVSVTAPWPGDDPAVLITPALVTTSFTDRGGEFAVCADADTVLGGGAFELIGPAPSRPTVIARSARIRGVVYDNHGRPVQLAIVSAKPAGSDRYLIHPVLTDAQGLWSMSVASGCRTFRASRGSSYSESARVCVGPGGEASVRMSSLAECTARLSGIALERSRPAAGVHIRSGIATTVSDSEGRFTLACAAPLLLLRAEGYLVAHVDVRSGAGVTKLHLVAGGRLRGRVISNGQPVAGAPIEFQSELGTRRQMSLPDGSYARDLEPGEHSITVSDPFGQRDTRLSLTVAANAGTIVRDLVLPAPLMIVGSLRSETGVPVPRVHLTIRRRDKSDPAGLGQSSDSAGRFRFRGPGLEPGLYEVTVDDPAWKLRKPAGIEMPLSVPADKPLELIVIRDTTRDRAIRGRVVDRAGRPLAYARACLPLHGCAVTGGDGLFLFDQLPAGVPLTTVWSPDGTSTREVQMIPGDPRSSIELDISPPTPP